MKNCSAVLLSSLQVSGCGLNVMKDTAQSVFTSLKELIASIWQPLMDVFSDGSEPMTAMQFFKNVIKIVEIAFIYFSGQVKLSVEVIIGVVMELINILRMLADVAIAALHFDAAGVQDAWKNGFKAIEDEAKKRFNNIAKIAEETGERMSAAALGDVGTPMAHTDVKTKMGGNEASSGAKAKKGKADKSQMGAWEAELAQAKVTYQMQHDLREMSKQEEIAFWNSKRALSTKSGGESVAIDKKTADLQLEILKKASKDKIALTAEEINAKEKAANDALAVEQQAAEQDFNLGKITKQKLLDLQQQFEDKRYAIEMQAQSARAQAAIDDPTQNDAARQKQLDKLLEIERDHALKLQKIQNDSALEVKKSEESMLAPITSAIEKSVNGMIQGTLTLKKAVSSIFQSILGEFVSVGAKLVANWLLNTGKMEAITKAFSAMKIALGITEATADAEQKTQETLGAGIAAKTQVGLAAGVAGANGVASFALAPWPIDLGAPAFGASMSAAATALGSIPGFAVGAWNVPSDMFTKIHKGETIVPAQFAEKFRDGGGSGGGSGGDVHLHVHSLDVKGVKDWMKANSHAVAPALRQIARNFTPVKP